MNSGSKITDTFRRKVSDAGKGMTESESDYSFGFNHIPTRMMALTGVIFLALSLIIALTPFSGASVFFVGGIPTLLLSFLGEAILNKLDTIATRESAIAERQRTLREKVTSMGESIEEKLESLDFGQQEIVRLVNYSSRRGKRRTDDDPSNCDDVIDGELVDDDEK